MTSLFSAVLAQTTAYTPSPGCLSGLTVQTTTVNKANTTTVYIFPGTNLLSAKDAPTTCLPEPYINALRSATPSNPVVSPAVTCPVGYHEACSMVGVGANVAAGGNFQIWPALNRSQTAIGCCPADYQCVSQSPYQCISTLTNGETVSATTTMGKGRVVTQMMTTNSSYQVTATAVRYVYMRNSTSSYSGSGSFPYFTQSRSTLPIGGIVVIVVLGVLIVCCIGGCCFWHRRRHREMREEKAKKDQEAADAAAFGKPELDAGPPANTIGSDAPEVIGIGPREMETPVAELPAGEAMIEMPGEGQSRGTGIARKPLASPPLTSESPDIYGSSEVSASPVAVRHAERSASAEVAATPVERGPPVASGAL